jgi:hypothetical protein
MKAKLTFIIVLCSLSLFSFGQGDIKLNMYSAYAFDDKFDSYYDSDEYYKGKIIGGYQWGVGLEYMLHKYYGIELSWMQQNTTAPITYQGGAYPIVKSTNFNLSSNYILIGTNRYFPMNNSKIEPYFGLGLGMSLMALKNPENGRKTDKEFFAWSLKTGTNIFFTDKVGLKLQAQLLSSVQSVGGSFYFGTGGSGAGLSTYSSIMQICLGGGLVLKLGDAKK